MYRHTRNLTLKFNITSKALVAYNIGRNTANDNNNNHIHNTVNKSDDYYKYNNYDNH